MDESLDSSFGLEDLRWLHRLARQLVQDPDEADDAVQDTVLVALTRAPRGVGAPRRWLATVLHNVVRQGRRGAARRTARERERGAPDLAGSTAEVVEELAWHRTLVDEVNELSEPYRSTIVHRFLHSRSPREIAREQGIPVKTVHTRIDRGLAHLRRALDRRHGGDRRAWMSAVAALAAPAGSGVEPGALVIGGISMGTKTGASAAVLVAALGVYFLVRTPPAESPRIATLEPPAAGEELASVASDSEAEDAATDTARRTPVAEDPAAGAAAVAGTNVLRVLLSGLTEEDALRTTVTAAGVGERNERFGEIRDSWTCRGLTSELDLDPLLASAAAHPEGVRVDELEIVVDHPHHLSERTRVSLARGMERASGETVHEVRVRLARLEF